jgi:hypothetical protein
MCTHPCFHKTPGSTRYNPRSGDQGVTDADPQEIEDFVEFED